MSTNTAKAADQRVDQQAAALSRTQQIGNRFYLGGGLAVVAWIIQAAILGILLWSTLGESIPPVYVRWMAGLAFALGLVLCAGLVFLLGCGGILAQIADKSLSRMYELEWWANIPADIKPDPENVRRSVGAAIFAVAEDGTVIGPGVGPGEDRHGR